MAQADVSTPGNSPIPCNLVLIGFMGTGKTSCGRNCYSAPLFPVNTQVHGKESARGNLFKNQCLFVLIKGGFVNSNNVSIGFITIKDVRL